MKFLSFLLAFGLLTSCGEMFMEKKKDKKEEQNLDVDPEAISNLLVKPIDGDLSNIQDALEFFVDIVKTDRPGFLSLNELKKYINQVMEDIDQDVLKMLDGVFEINSLLTGDSKLYMKKANIKKIIKILKVVNHEFVKHDLSEIFKNEDEISYLEHLSRKAKVYHVFHTIKKEIKNHYKLSNTQINIIDFTSKFRSESNSEMLDTLKDLLFVKKIFLGGDKEVLTSKEFGTLIDMMDSGAKIVFDIMHIASVKHAQSEAEPIIATLTQNIETMISSLYYPAGSTVTLFSIQELKSALGRFFDGIGTFLKYDKSIRQAKDIFLLNNSVNFGANEIHFLLSDIILKNLKRGGFFIRTYKDKEDILNSPEAITKDIEGIITTSDQEYGFRIDFNRIAKDYWFFKGEEFSATYGSAFKRSAFGMYEVSLYEDIVTRVMDYYTDKNGSAYLGYKLSFEQLVKLIEDFDDLLIGEGMLLEGRARNIGETIALMTSLFQKQSDGKGDDIEVNEMVEFAISVLSAHSLSKEGFKYLQTVCSTDSEGRITPSCFRANFVSMFDQLYPETDKTISSKLPKFYKYIVDIQGAELTSFLEEAEGFSRNCTVFSDGTAVPMTDVDLFMMMAGLMSVEQTFTRFDRGSGSQFNNNVLDVSEIMNSYHQVYKGSVKALMPKMAQGLSEYLFQYLIKYKRVPTTFQLIKFRLKRKSKRESSATRATLATVLKTISLESEENKKNPYPCETIR